MPVTIIMAKRLSKAQRGKRRWIGIIIPNNISSRNQLTEHIDELPAQNEISRKPKLIEFNQATLSGGRSTGIIEVKLEDYETFRRLLKQDNQTHECSLVSFTASGKINLVRERMMRLK